MWPINITNTHTHISFGINLSNLFDVSDHNKSKRSRVYVNRKQQTNRKTTYINDDRITDDINHKNTA